MLEKGSLSSLSSAGDVGPKSGFIFTVCLKQQQQQQQPLQGYSRHKLNKVEHKVFFPRVKFNASSMHFCLVLLLMSAAHHAKLYFIYQSETTTLLCEHYINPTTHIIQKSFILFKEENIPHT